MLTHVDQNQRPTMVDVTAKSTSIRMAMAQCQVQLPKDLKAFIQGDELQLKKGPVFQTAIIAGTMAVKKTYELIPFCHQIPIESCKVKIQMDEDLLVTITCKVKSIYKTGVEMEALHGAMMAGLTIYDMCKAISHNIILKETKLIFKTGGKHTLLGRPTMGLVLTGGKSERMQEDKALISYNGMPHAEFIYQTLAKYCDEVFISCKSNQWKDTVLESYPSIIDKFDNAGTIGGMLSAFDKYPEANWIIVACDLIFFNDKTVQKLLSHFDEDSIATCFKNVEKDFPEALCALYTPKARNIFHDAFQSGVRCPVKVLGQVKCEMISQEDGINLANINSKQELLKVQNEFH